MKLPEQIREFEEGEDPGIMSAERLNEIVAVCNAVLTLRAGPGIRITRADSGILIERVSVPKPVKK